jgi:hypothetical protein
MFKCQVTHKTSKLGETCHKLVVQTRERIYYRKFFNEEINDWDFVEIGRGTEIVKEINATEEGARLYGELSDEEKEEFVKTLH